MANLALVVADRVRVVESNEQMTLAAGEAITAGDRVAINPSTGKWRKALASEVGYGVALRSVSAYVGLTAIADGIIDGFDLSGASYGDLMYPSATAAKISDADVGEQETQTLTISGTPTGGTFTLTYESAETTDIAYDASAATIQAALEALATIGVGNVDVSGSGPFVITFIGDLTDMDVSLIVGDGASLTGGTSPDATVAETNAGVVASPIAQVIPVTDVLVGGSYGKVLRVKVPLA